MAILDKNEKIPSMTDKLFVYGSLKDPEVQQLFMGRIIKGTPNTISGYTLSTIDYGLETFPVLIPDGLNKQKINGLVLELSSEEIQVIDNYEGEEYVRIQATLADNTKAWVYVSAILP